MKLIPFTRLVCGEVTLLKDAFTDGELLVETVAQVNRHGALCGACRVELEDTALLKHSLRRAARRLEAPRALRVSVKQTVQACSG